MILMMTPPQEVERYEGPRFAQKISHLAISIDEPLRLKQQETESIGVAGVGFSEEEIARNHWKFAAIVVDRLALLVSILFAIVSTIVLLVSAV
jgi:hypothetical protein